MSVTVSGTNAEKGLYTSAALQHPDGEAILEVVNASDAARPLRVTSEGRRIEGAAGWPSLASADLKAENRLDEPARVAPVEKALTASSGGFDLTIPAR